MVSDGPLNIDGKVDVPNFNWQRKQEDQPNRLALVKACDSRKGNMLCFSNFPPTFPLQRSRSGTMSRSWTELARLKIEMNALNSRLDT